MFRHGVWGVECLPGMRVPVLKSAHEVKVWEDVIGGLLNPFPHRPRIGGAGVVQSGKFSVKIGMPWSVGCISFLFMVHVNVVRGGS